MNSYNIDPVKVQNRVQLRIPTISRPDIKVVW